MVQRENVELEKMLKNAYVDAKSGFDTAANELSKVGCAASYQMYVYLLSGTQKTCKARKTLKNGALDAKIGVDTAENEPRKRV